MRPLPRVPRLLLWLLRFMGRKVTGLPAGALTLSGDSIEVHPVEGWPPSKGVTRRPRMSGRW